MQNDLAPTTSVPPVATFDDLLSIGLVKIAPTRINEPIQAAPADDELAAIPLFDNISLAGSLHVPGARLVTVPVRPDLTQPPLYWKAFAFALKSRFTTSGDLYQDGQALFIAGPNQAGVPIGSPFPEPITNYHTFMEADTMQVMNKPSFSLEGASYFDYLNS